MGLMAGGLVLYYENAIFCLCLKLCLNLSWFEFGKIYVRVMALKCHVGDQSTFKKKKHVLAEQHVPKSAKRVGILTMLAGPKQVCERLSGRTRLAVLARNLVFTNTIPLGNFKPGMLETKFPHEHTR